MDRPPPTAPTVPVRRHDRWPGGLVVLALGFILVAIAKPWPAPPVEPPASGTLPPTPPSPEPKVEQPSNWQPALYLKIALLLAAIG